MQIMTPEERKVLLIYSTTDGHCLKIANYMADCLNTRVDIVSIEDNIPDLSEYQGIIIGSSIRYGVHRAKIKKYIDLHYQEIQSKTNAFYSVSLIARKPERRTVATNPYAKKFLEKIKWKPQHIALIGGVLNYPGYSFWDRLMIQLIMKITKGPTDPATVQEYTDWEQVKKFAMDFKSELFSN